MKALLPILVTDEGIEICFKFEQSQNEDSPIVVIVIGIVISLILGISLKLRLFSDVAFVDIIKDEALVMIDVSDILLGSYSTSLMLLHSTKALLSIDVTDDGIDTFVNDEQFEKDSDLIEVTELGILICFNFEHP